MTFHDVVDFFLHFVGSESWTKRFIKLLGGGERGF